MSDARLLTITEVAERLRITVLCVRGLRHEGRFAPAIKIGRRVMWDERDLDAWIAAQRERGSAA
jgi:excisionase family DNA binding protein